ncbi:hypothetical protein Tco_0320728 [Tanacetum coccineum]
MIDQGVTAALTARDANRNGDDSHTSGTGVRRNEHAARECTYPDFLKCKPLNFKGLGVVGLTPENALTWWNSHVKTTTPEVAHAMPWKTLKKMMTDKYCPRELALMCDRMFPKESDKVEKYVGGLPDMIHGSVMATKPKTMQEPLSSQPEQWIRNQATFAKRTFGETKRN